MFKVTRNIKGDPKGYSLTEMLIVTGLILILATVPISLLRRSRDKTYEAEALRALRMVALAYENYYAVNGHKYPNYQSSGVLTDDLDYADAEQIWDDLVRQQLIPTRYSGYPHDTHDLLARGYVFSIMPVDSGNLTGNRNNTYAFALVPYDDSPATRGIAMLQGVRYSGSYPGAVPRKMHGQDFYSLNIYTLPD